MKWLWVLGLVGGLTAPAVGASPDPKDLAIPPAELSKARDLVQRLGSPAFREREAAHAELAKMGRLARPALVEAMTTAPSAEVRSRTVRLLPKAEVAELQARIDTFLADTDGKFTHDLPAFGLFRKHVGEDKAARDLYVAMVKSRPNLGLLVALGESPAEAGRAIADRRADLYHDMNPTAFGGRFGGGGSLVPKPPALTDLSALLIGEMVVSPKDIPRSNQFGFVTASFFLQQQAALDAVNNPNTTPHAEAFRRIFAKWFDTRTAPDDLSNAVHVAQRFPQMKESTPLLRRAVTTDGVQGYTRSQALVVLVQRHGKDETAFVKGLLKNDATVAPVFLGQNPMGGAIQATCQLRDVALAVLVAQSGQSITDYGFTVSPGNQANPLANPYPTYAFTADDHRDKAMKKWAEWEAAHAKDPPKK